MHLLIREGLSEFAILTILRCKRVPRFTVRPKMRDAKFHDRYRTPCDSKRVNPTAKRVSKRGSGPLANRERIRTSLLFPRWH